MKKPIFQNLWPSCTLASVLAVNLLATSGDITGTWASPMYPKLYSNDSSINPLGRPITPTEDSWIGSISNIGSFIGAIPAGLLADKIGRKWALLLMAIPHVTAYLTYAFATEISWFLAARFWSGIAVGAGYALLPMYIAEISEDSNRGAMSVTLNIFWSFGNFLPVGIGPFLSVRDLNLILATIPVAFFILFLLLAPESPEYLVHHGRVEEAEEVLILLRNVTKKSDIEKEIIKIKETKHDDGSLLDLFKDRSLAYGFFISIILVILIQFSGQNAINNYTQLILEDANIGVSSDISSSLVGLWNFFGSFSTILVVERLGRKPPLLITLAGCALSTGMLGVFYFVKNTSGDTSSVSWLPLASLIGYILFFNVGGSIPWTFSSEIFPNNVKAVTSSSISATCWAASFVVTKYFNTLKAHIGEAETFWVFAGFCVFGIFFCLVAMPETKGKSYAEIYALLMKKSKSKSAAKNNSNKKLSMNISIIDIEKK